ncbi:MAG: class I SAM-dependent methyltransferase [Spirochaetota bacterium]
MTIDTDKRHYLRRTRENTYCVLDDYEPQFEVVEISAHGFSFACDREDSRFRENMSLNDISILNSESQEIIHATGVVRHRSSFDAVRDRVGVSFSSKRLDNTITGRVRLPRRRPSIELFVQVMIGETTASGVVVDYNIRSARVSMLEPSGLSAGDAVELSMGTTSRRLYEGAGTVIRTRDDSTEIVVEFSDNLLELRSVSLTEKAMYAREIIDQKRTDLDSFAGVSAEYKALVSDWRMYLEMVEEVVGREEAKAYLVSAADERHYLEEVGTDVFERMREFIAELNRIAPTIDPEDVGMYKRLFRLRMEPFLRRSPLACSIMDKIHGYHGDFETVKQFFANPYVGPNLFGKLMNRFITTLEPVRAHVNRIGYLHQEILDTHRASSDGIRILSLGSGPAEEIMRLLRDHDFAKPLHVTLIDVDAHALADFYERMQYHQKPNVSIELVNFNIINILVGKKTGLEPASYDITYCAGMFDYFKDRFCRKYIEFLIDLTAPGARFYYTNVHSRNFARYFMDYGGGWEIYHRGEQETLALAPPEHACEVLTDETGTNIYVKGIRSADSASEFNIGDALKN